MGIGHDLLLHLIRDSREYFVKLGWGPRVTATRGTVSARGNGIISEAIGAGLFASDFRLTKAEMEQQTCRDWLQPFLDGQYDGAMLHKRPDGSPYWSKPTDAEYEGEFHMLTRDTLDATTNTWVRDEEFEPDNLPVRDMLQCAYRETTSLLFGKPGEVAAACESEPASEERPAKRQRGAPAAAAASGPGARVAPTSLVPAVVRYRVVLERKQTCEDLTIKCLRTVTTERDATILELQKLGALYLGPGSVSSTGEETAAPALAAIRSLKTKGCGPTLASFKKAADKMAFVSFLHDEFGRPRQTDGLFGAVTRSAGMSNEQFDSFGSNEADHEEPTDAEGDDSSVLEQLMNGEYEGRSRDGDDPDAVRRAVGSEVQRQALQFSRGSVLREGGALGAGVTGGGRVVTPAGVHLRTTRAGRRPVDYSAVNRGSEALSHHFSPTDEAANPQWGGGAGEGTCQRCGASYNDNGCTRAHCMSEELMEENEVEIPSDLTMDL